MKKLTQAQLISLGITTPQHFGANLEGSQYWTYWFPTKTWFLMVRNVHPFKVYDIVRQINVKRKTKMTSELMSTLEGVPTNVTDYVCIYGAYFSKDFAEKRMAVLIGKLK
jgi:hypothetical protein